MGQFRVRGLNRPRRFRPHRAQLGHRQQGDQAQRFQRVHEPGHRRQGLYLLHVLRKRMDYPELKRAVLEQAGREPRGIYQYYKELSQQPQTARSEPLSAMAKRLGLLR